MTLFNPICTSDLRAQPAASLVALLLCLALAQKATCMMAEGGNATNDIGVFRVHTFTNSGTFTVTEAGSIDVLVVAGGGGGGNCIAGGGGAGGLIYTSDYPIAAGEYNVVVGAGGAGSASSTLKASSGANSAFGPLLAFGGGGGGGWDCAAGDGASGGGQSGQNPAGATAYTNGQGNAGGTGSNNRNGGAGGGGAGGAGINGISSLAGSGGVGLAHDISGVLTYYAGGGGGGARSGSAAAAPGGTGGGGGGSIANPGTNAVPHTGGGGGGGGYDGTYWSGGSGGSGIVIVRYVLGDPTVSNVSAMVAVSNVTLTGYLVSTGRDANVSAAVYWGRNDAGKNMTGWTYTNRFPGWVAEGPMSTNVTPDKPGVPYYFRFFASNSYGHAWATPAGTFIWFSNVCPGTVLSTW